MARSCRSARRSSSMRIRKHTFVGHFIGSPGMNVLPCQVENGVAVFAGRPIDSANAAVYRGNGKMLELGVRPEFVSLAPDGIPVDIVKVLDAGRYQIVESRAAGSTIKLLVREGETVPQGSAFVRFAADHTRIYQDGWVVRADEKDRQPDRMVVRPAGGGAGGVQRHHPADDGRQLFRPGILRRQRLLLVGRALVRGGSALEPLPRGAAAPDPVHRHRAGDRDPARPRHRARHAAPRPLGIGLPRSDGAAAAHSLERGRRHVEHHGAARDRPARQGDQRPGHHLQLYPPADLRHGSPSS